jgi:eukaryotic-like serine/threonine-protein kinase
MELPSREATREWVGELAVAVRRTREAVGNPEHAVLGSSHSKPDESALPCEEQTRKLLGTSNSIPDSLIASWTADLGPTLAPLLENSLRHLLPRLQAALQTARTMRVVGRYELVERLGVGGQGEAWLVREPRSQCYHMMKIPTGAREGGTRWEPSPFALETMGREVQIARDMHHPNVVRVVDYDLKGRVPFLVMTYVIGVDLEGYTKVERLSLEESKPIVDDMCAGLMALHQHGIMHGDMKPANVLLFLEVAPKKLPFQFEPSVHRNPLQTPVSHAVLIDFGISCRFNEETTAPGVRGTLRYLSPEQARREAPAAPSDVYSLAATVYNMLTGREFFEHVDVGTGETDWYMPTLQAHASEEPLSSRTAVKGLPRRLAKLLRKATCLDPRQRISAVEFRETYAKL